MTDQEEARRASGGDNGRVPFENGSLAAEELAAAFTHLPADVTFVDSNGIVRYYSAYRIFSRPPECLDRSVLECHSEASRPGIARMLSEFASGWRDEAVFAARKRGRAVDVHYVAVRGRAGEYLGCLEIAQWADESVASSDGTGAST
jgi:DUF438 domain-containing protein